MLIPFPTAPAPPSLASPADSGLSDYR